MNEGIFALLGVLTGFLGNIIVMKMRIKEDKRKINIEKLSPIQEDLINLWPSFEIASDTSENYIYQRLDRNYEIEKKLQKYAMTIIPYIRGNGTKLQSFVKHSFDDVKMKVDESMKSNESVNTTMLLVYEYDSLVIQKWVSLLILIHNEMR